MKTGEGRPFEEGVRVTIEATPAAGNKFTGWTATGITLTEEQKTQNPLMIFMPAENVTLTAAFAEVESSSITPTAAAYDKNAQGTNHKELAFTLKTADAALKSVKLDETVLVKTTDYTLNEGTLTILYGALDKQTGTVRLTVMLEGGEVLTAKISITDIKNQQSSGGSGVHRGSSSKTGGVVVVPGNTTGTTNSNYREPSVDHVSSNYFADVNTDSTWAYGYIEHLASARIVSGDQNRNFAPKNNVTREEFLKMLMGALNIEATAAGEGFADVRSGDWFAPYIYTARNLGIVNGIGDGTFGIGQIITREDMAVMASRTLVAAGKTLTQTQQVALVDAVQISDYAQSSVQQLASAGVICGNEHAAFRPQDSALREEAAKVIYYIWVA